jgi:transposase InsO family protein
VSATAQFLLSNVEGFAGDGGVQEETYGQIGIVARPRYPTSTGPAWVRGPKRMVFHEWSSATPWHHQSCSRHWPSSAASSPNSTPSNPRAAARRTRSTPIAAIADYIDGFYNPCRRHSSIGYVSPIECELKFMSEKVQKVAA